MRRAAPFFLALACLLAREATAQLATQTIDLLPGWNAVHLEVTPVNDDPDVVFGAAPVESAWQFVPRTQVTRFIEDPNELIPEADDWLGYFPPASPSRPARNLFAVNGGTSYLIKLGGAAPASLTVTGRPAILPLRWQGDAFNFVGFTVDAISPPSFASFLGTAPAFVGRLPYRLNNATGRWEQIAASTPMRRGEAFWIETHGETEYQGPVEFTVPLGAELDFGSALTTLRGTLRNRTNAVRTVTLSVAPSAEAPAGGSAALVAGEVPLSRFEATAGANPEFGFVPFTTYVVTVPANGTLEIDFSVRRNDMAPFTIPDGAKARYQSLMIVSTDLGSQQVVPVVADGSAAKPAGKKSTLKGTDVATPLDGRAGLWTGTAAVSKVSEAGSASDKVTPKDTATEFQFPIIVHMDGEGQARLLQQVYLMYKAPVLAPDPEVLGFNVVAEPGRYVLVTDDSLLSQYEGVRVVDNTSIGRRLSSAAFGFRDPIAMTRAGAAFACDVALDFDDPLNPFKHKYHPNHDNLNASYTGMVPEGFESYTVIRRVELDFSSAVPDDFSGAGFGDTVAAGVYRETITGLHREVIHVEGTFRIAHVASVEVLNDGN